IGRKKLEELIREKLIPHLMHYDLSGFQSMFNAFPEEGARLGAEVALKYNQGVTNWQVSPGGAMLEELCVKSLCKLFGLNKKADATFMYCGTYANQQALYLALHKKAEQEGFDFTKKGIKGFKNPEKLKVICTKEAHFSIKHAVRILGLGEESLLFIDVDRNRRMNINSLQKVVSNTANQFDIFCVMATTGTTSTGSVDPVFEIANICSGKNIWLHVDGAYGLAYSLVPEWKPLFKGIDIADSISWDPHKQLGIPIPNSVLFVKNSDDFLRVALHSAYFNRETDTEPNPGVKSPPSTRPFSALPLVCSLRFQGMKKVIERLRVPLEAIKSAAEFIKNEDEMELIHQPDTGILCFRIIPDFIHKNDLDKLQKFLFDEIMKRGERSIAISEIDNNMVLRIVAISPSVTFDAIKNTFSDLFLLAKKFNV
ncbi:pyridoxal phosphate-dependent decarboxylase family protein, partial [Bacteroidota bacterium]